MSTQAASGAKAKAAIATAAEPLKRFGESAIATRANAVTIARLVLTEEESDESGDRPWSKAAHPAERILDSVGPRNSPVERSEGDNSPTAGAPTRS